MVGVNEHVKICDGCCGKKGISGLVHIWKQFPDGRRETIKKANLVVDEGHTLMTDLLGAANINDKMKNTTTPNANPTTFIFFLVSICIFLFSQNFLKFL